MASILPQLAGKMCSGEGLVTRALSGRSSSHSLTPPSIRPLPAPLAQVASAAQPTKATLQIGDMKVDALLDAKAAADNAVHRVKTILDSADPKAATDAAV